MANLVRKEMDLIEKDTFGLFHDFRYFTSSEEFTSVISDSGSATVSDGGIGGILVLSPSDGTVADNDETYVRSTTEYFKFANDKPLMGECRLQFAEAATNAANVFFGFADAISANTLVDNGGGLKTSFSGACIYKVDGATTWRCVSSNGSTQTISTSSVTAGGSAYQTLRVEVHEDTSTACIVRFFVNGNPLVDSTSGREIVHRVLYASATDMHVGAGVKNGSTTMETLNIDYIAAYQLR